MLNESVISLCSFPFLRLQACFLEDPNTNRHSVYVIWPIEQMAPQPSNIPSDRGAVD
jgi:hypothetical protein